ncbi:phosphomannose isomerase type II C-terminal cupin domain [Thermostichus vulcanus]|uniref:Phosphomannose isomerase type II C-terminal cupin domain n=1 Tax=Thermostichus vulcanus str. 'Rupite' TaxID=2813851 RepID=A0ABT0CC58_THEVL|nr:phosphomannose isomerase type II C-terminal cupin domain [Thermostichus vulcanus]MCJ2543343.1 phosphomannose isomerase type II C-terminal cupin domain [Thermostichus vulcanus str. 'Rupite']
MLETPKPDLAPPDKLPVPLSAETLAQLIESNTESRPWGTFTVLEEGPGYKIKRIVVLPKHRLSLQMHYHRSEHWIVVAGTAKVTCGDEEKIITSNQSTYVPPCTQHRLENPGVIPLVIIEVQNGQYLGEDDIIRFSDDYARTNGSQPQKA